MADRSVAGGGIVEEHNLNPFASDTDNGKKIGHVENRALSKLETKKVSNSTFINSMHRSLDYRFRSDSEQQNRDIVTSAVKIEFLRRCCSFKKLKV